MARFRVKRPNARKHRASKKAGERSAGARPTRSRPRGCRDESVAPPQNDSAYGPFVGGRARTSSLDVVTDSKLVEQKKALYFLTQSLREYHGSERYVIKGIFEVIEFAYSC